MTYPVSACVFIRNNNKGAFCLWESIASILPFVSEFVVMDLGSDDGTLEILREITAANEKFKLIIKDKFPFEDANVFAVLANELIDFCRYENVLYFQADEIWHQNLLQQMEMRFQRNEFDLSFWRIQFKANFQSIKWSPHIVHRVGPKNDFNFVHDGMNSDRYLDAKFCYEKYNAGWFTRWGAEFNLDGSHKQAKKEDTPDKMPTYDMITDVSLVGGFLENIGVRKGLHSPFWNEGSGEPEIRDIDNDNVFMTTSKWMEKQRQNPDWIKQTSPFDLPHILKPMVGVTKYYMRDELLLAIKANDTRRLLGL